MIKNCFSNSIAITFVLLCISLLVGDESLAQNVLTGKIIDADQLMGIAGATVYIPDLRRTTVSDSAGSFSFKNLPPSTIQIQFSAIGFKTSVKTITPGAISDINVELELSAIELEEMLVTSNNSKLSDNTPFAANSIPISEVHKYNGLSSMSNLSYQPGVDKITIGNGINKPVIRGLSFNRILLYGQGTRIENQQWDDHHDLGLSDIGIDNVEIVRGPAALIFGPDALGGAIIFTDEKPAPAGRTIADANLGFASNTLGIIADAGIKSAGKNGLFYGLRIGGATHTSYVQGEGEEENNNGNEEEEEEFAPNSKMMNYLVKGNVGVSKKWGVSKLSYSLFNQQIGIIEDESGDTLAGKEDEEGQREREFEAPYQDVTSHILSLENTVFTGKSKVNFNLSYQYNDRKEYEPLPDKQKELAIGLNLSTTTYDVKWTSNSEKKLGVTVGTQGLFLENVNKGLESLVPDAEVSNIAGYGLIRYDLGKLNLLGGVRYDMREIEAESYEPVETEEDTFIIHHHTGIVPGTIDTIHEPEVEIEREYKPVSFSIGACYKLMKQLTIKINGVTGFSAPNYAQLGTFGKHEGTYRFERGNTDLKVEQNLEGDLGIMWESPYITINVSTYINKIKDYIYIVNTGDTMQHIKPGDVEYLPIYDYKQNDATINGFEAGFDFHPRSLKWFDLKCSYAFIRGTFDSGGDLPYIPADKLTSEIKLSKEKMGKLNNTFVSLIVSNYSEQDRVTEYENSTEGSTILDFHLGASFKLSKQRPMVELYCTNVLNTGYFNHLSLVKEIGVREMGRNIGVKLFIPIK